MQYWWEDFLEFVKTLINGLLGNKVASSIIIGLLIAFGIYIAQKFIKWITKKIRNRFFQKPKIQS